MTNSSWLSHVRKTMHQHPGESFTFILKRANKTYRRGGGKIKKKNKKKRNITKKEKKRKKNKNKKNKNKKNKK